MKNLSTPSFRSICPFVLFLLAFLTLTAAASAQSPLPTFAKSFAPATIGPGSVATLTFVITNSSAFPVRSLAFADTLPAGVTIASPASASSTCQDGTVTAAQGGATITYSDGGVGGGQSCTVIVNVTSATPGTHTNVSGALTSDAGNSGSATATLTVATDRPGFTKSFSPSAVFFGGRSRLTFTIDNTANAAPRVNLAFTDTLPVGMVVASPANRSKTCAGGTFSAPAGSGVISYTPFSTQSSVAASSSCTLSVDVVANAVGALGNVTGELTSQPGPFGGTELSSGKASATLTSTVERIAVSKTFTDDPAAPGGTVTLSFTVRNLDRGFDATSIAFTDDLDATLSGLEAVGLPLANPCGPGSQLAGTGVLSLTGGNLAAEATCTFSATLQVPAGAVSGSYTNTTSAITADVGGTPVTGDPASDTLFVEPVPVLTKTFTDDPAGAGGAVTLELTITNSSATSPATDIAFEDVFDIVLPTASSVPAAGFCGPGSTAIFIAAGINPAQLVVADASLAPGDSCTFSVVLGVTVGAPAGTYPNTTSEITATIDGETATGNPASDSLEIVAAPQPSKEFIDDPVAPGDTVTLEITLVHDENAPGDATAIALTDDLAATLPGLAAIGLPQSDVCGIGSTLSGTTTLSLTGGTLSPGESCTLSVTLQVPSTAAAGRHTNTTSNVTATVAGVAATENAASDDLRVAGLALSKQFIDDPVLPGGTVTLRFTVDNVSPTETATNIAFSDDLNGALSGLAATGLPANDVCGTGSSLTGSTVLTFSGGTLGPLESCSFDVALQVPSGAAAGVYVNVASGFRGNFGGSTVFFDNALDNLTIETNFLAIAKEFVNDPVSPGDNVTLRFTLTNLETSKSVSSIAFTDDLDAAVAGLVNAGGTLTGICGAGSQISGSGVLSFTGGSLAAAGSCTFDVTLSVPSSVALGTVATNTSGLITGLFPVTGAPATDVLRIDFLSFSKAFDGPAAAGSNVTLTFTIQNPSQTGTFVDVTFTDDLDNVLTGLVATGLPATDVCGEGSELAGTSFLTLDDATLMPGGSCTFSVTLNVPASAIPGDYLNETGELLQGGVRAAASATATLTVIADDDADDDGVIDGLDVCPGTVIPEGVPTVRLGTNRFALVDGDGVFDTTPSNGNGPGASFTIDDTAGCSCEQIIAAQGLGNGHVKFGCSLGAMRDWVDLVNP